jgi:hypothetical protein
MTNKEFAEKDKTFQDLCKQAKSYLLRDRQVSF